MRPLPPLLLLLLFAAAALAGEPAPPRPLGHDAWFASDPAPSDVRVDGNPLDYAGARLGIDVRDFVLPRAEETDYRFVARLPVIDAVMNDPLYLKRWAEEVSARLTEAHRDEGLASVRRVLAVLRGVEDPAAAPAIFTEPVRASLEAVAAVLRAADIDAGHREALLDLFRDYVLAEALARSARDELDPGDLAFFEARPEFYVAPDGKTMPSLTGDVTTHLAFIEKARRVRFESIFAASLHLAAAVGRYRERVRALPGPGPFAEPGRRETLIRVDTPLGRVLIAGPGDHVHQRDVEFLVEFGGDDVYRNNAGACGPGLGAAALCVDLGGHDRYEAPGRKFVQGFGFLGAGFLVDLQGNDVYVARHFAQGAGILGVGALWDAGGDDRYVAHAFCQGAGAFGAGILLDSAGEDFYDGATLCQGGATTLGIGVLSDLAGDDRYHLNVGPGKDALGNLPGYGQGGALSFRHMPWRGTATPYGGIGLLLDAAGNDRYRTRGWCDQGGSYLMSLGVLVDDAGNDHYSSHTGQGSGIHITAAALIDRDGHDVYEGGFRAGGSGGDRSPGLLLDYAGDDVYLSRTSSYGTGVKPFSFSLFIDYAGDDRYVCARPAGEILFNDWDSFGGVWPESDPALWPYAICLDLGGRDDYEVRNRRNDSERHSFGHGLHLDMEWKGGDVIGKPEDPLPRYGPVFLPASLGMHPLAESVRALAEADLFARFRAAGEIVAAGAPALEPLVELLLESVHRSINRDALECVHVILAAGDGREKPELLAKLLHARDPEIRAVVADDFGVYAIPGAEDGLVEACMTDENDAVRRFALRSLHRLKAARALPLAGVMARTDPSPWVRRRAAFFLGGVQGDDDPLPVLLEILENDPDWTVRTAAASALAGLADPRALPALREAARASDVYLQREAARGLANLGEPEGVEILIRSLAFPSIDAFYNYDRNVPNDIAVYLGHDLDEKDRYDRRRWMAWFEAHGDGVDIRANAEAHRAFRAFDATTRGLPPVERAEALETFLADHPGNRRAEDALASLLNGLAWNAVTAPRGSPGFDAEKGLAWAKRAVELHPEPNIIDTLAEAHLAAGNLDEAESVCVEMLAKKPGWKMFADRMKRIETLRAKAAVDEETPAWIDVTAPAGFEEDAAKLRRWIGAAVKVLEAEFSDFDPKRLVEPVELEFRLYGEANEKAREGSVRLESGMADGRYRATVHLLAPSRYGRGRSNLGEAADDEYFLGLVVHEIAAVFLDLAARAKPRGWRFYDAPAWFVQGWEEYLAVALASEHSRTVTLPLYVDTVKTQPMRVREAPSPELFAVEDVYLDGPVLLAFLHDVFGRERMHDLLRSEAPALEQALLETLEIEPEGLWKCWRAWLRE